MVYSRLPLQIWAGNPAKFLRNLTEEESAFIYKSAENYTNLAATHAKETAKSFEEIEADKARRKEFAQRDSDYDSHLGIDREKAPLA